jgi:hypothetical protein
VIAQKGSYFPIKQKTTSFALVGGDSASLNSLLIGQSLNQLSSRSNHNRASIDANLAPETSNVLVINETKKRITSTQAINSQDDNVILTIED